MVAPEVETEPEIARSVVDVDASHTAPEPSTPPPSSELLADLILADLEVKAAAAPPPPSDLWADLRRDMHLDLHLDKKSVQQQIRWYQRNPDYLKRLAPRIQTYLPYIYRQTQLRSLPAELTFVPIIESALDEFAFSPGGAAGPWQFMRGTAKQYGLEINDWYDGRRDIVAATDAALTYLDKLHGRFGTWNLALASYNAGQGNVGKARRKKPGADFFALDLPRETQAYVPRILATAAIIHDPAAYGLELPEIEPKETFAVVKTHSQFQVNKLAQTLELSQAEFFRWNPALNRWATPPRGPHHVIVPVSLDLIEAQASIDAVPMDQRVDWREVEVRNGDTLSQIAHRHNTDVATLQTANKLTGTRIRAGKKLLIPSSRQALEQGPIRGGNNKQYVVRSGDSLWTIARAHGIPLQRIMRANQLGPRDTLQVGHQLTIPGVSSGRQITRKVRYKVRRGDSLARIAEKFNVSIKEITRWNDLDRNRYIQPGQGLLLYVNVTGG